MILFWFSTLHLFFHLNISNIRFDYMLLVDLFIFTCSFRLKPQQNKMVSLVIFPYFAKVNFFKKNYSPESLDMWIKCCIFFISILSFSNPNKMIHNQYVFLFFDISPDHHFEKMFNSFWRINRNKIEKIFFEYIH